MREPPDIRTSHGLMGVDGGLVGEDERGPRSWRAFGRIPWPTPTSLSSALALISASFLAYTQPSQLGEAFSAQFGLRWGGVWFSRGHFVRLKGA